MKPFRRSHSNVNKLPETVKAALNEQLLAGVTYDEIIARLRDGGYPVSRSAVGRHGKKYLAAFERLRRAREAARLIAEDNAERPSTEVHEANNALASQLIMEMLIDDETDPGDKLKAVKALTELQNAQVGTERLKIASRKAAGDINAAKSILKSKLFEQIGESHPDIARVLLQIADETDGKDGG
jgi:predicted ATP-grasp superfamily ATP-dependent carboligase